MSRNINVNPGQYKTRGRERQGEEIVHEDERARMAAAERLPTRAGAGVSPKKNTATKPATARKRRA